MRRFALTLVSAFSMIALAACGTGATTSPAASALNPSAASGSSVPSSGPSVSAAASGQTGGACAVAPAGSTATVKVDIKGFAFNPPTVQAKVGDVVSWTNSDSAAHTATMDDGSCDTGTISPGSAGMLTFTAPGTYTYHCKIHSQMKNVTVVVQ